MGGVGVTGQLGLDWAILAVSLANVILQLWLGLTVLLTADRRSGGVWLAGGGLLLAGLFFISHTAILGLGTNFFGAGLDLWWRVGWLPVVALPFAWYVVMLWYTGRWEEGRLHLPPGERLGAGVSLVLLVGLVGWLLLASPLPPFVQMTHLQVPLAGEGPLFLLIYPAYILLCLGLALNALRRPLPSSRMMGEAARRRPRPWLVAATLNLLVVSLLVAGIIAWLLWMTRSGLRSHPYATLAIAIGWLDLLIAGLITVATLLIGQAIVAYEIFTGHALPRREFRRQWHNAIILAGGYGLAVGDSLALRAPPVYSLLLTTGLMTVFYALLSWRSYLWRERYIRHLQPFVTSQHLYDLLLVPSPTQVEVAAPFQALVEEVLGARLAYLIALGPLAPLAPPVAYPAAARAPRFQPTALLESSGRMCVPLDPAQAGGAIWAVPLRSERGLIGALLLGPKRDEGLYTQEEIEIARASGERLIDTQASTEIARRLVTLQRQRLVESQLLDRQTRRVLHDEILPQLHAALLVLGQAADSSPEAVALLEQTYRQIAELLRTLPPATSAELARRGLFEALHRVVDQELEGSFDAVIWQIPPEAEHFAAVLPPLTAEVLFCAGREVLRNAARHGRGRQSNRSLQVWVSAKAQAGLILSIEDDGVGLTLPEMSQEDEEKGGQGLKLHSTMLAIVGGTLEIDSRPGTHSRISLSLPETAIQMLTFE